MMFEQLMQELFRDENATFFLFIKSLSLVFVNCYQHCESLRATTDVLS